MSDEAMKFIEDSINNKIKGLESSIRNRDEKIKELERKIERMRKDYKVVIDQCQHLKMKFVDMHENEWWPEIHAYDRDVCELWDIKLKDE